MHVRPVCGQGVQMDEELTSLVENTTFVRARALSSAEARHKKWRQMLAFPNINDCSNLRNHLARVCLRLVIVNDL